MSSISPISPFSAAVVSSCDTDVSENNSWIAFSAFSYSFSFTFIKLYVGAVAATGRPWVSAWALLARTGRPVCHGLPLSVTAVLPSSSRLNSYSAPTQLLRLAFTADGQIKRAGRVTESLATH